ncbi:hypothetical protein IV417_05130 [Alphaproteobacteria bacterium KMM 3653]|uniref:Uncharacterized protein n=1 Tax=Harenicola maris TaxID=2841044 RepID=A0AAP2G3F6_9RHOB|nr:hypothetical protein [Harenicola maris]
MDWMEQMRQVLRGHYDPAGPADVIGYLRGSADPGVWRQMERTGSGQMIILGNRPPSQREWAAAGVAQRGGEVVVTRAMLNGFMVLYGGFMIRPWGHIVVPDHDVRTLGFPGSLASWTRNYIAPQ